MTDAAALLEKARREAHEAAMEHSEALIRKQDHSPRRLHEAFARLEAAARLAGRLEGIELGIDHIVNRPVETALEWLKDERDRLRRDAEWDKYE